MNVMAKSNFFKKKLKNKVTVILEERKESGVVSIGFGIKTGALYENSKEKGISHFIEHMLFKGTKTRSSKQISEEIEKNGGVLNGYTEEEMTYYVVKIQSSKIKLGLDVLSDMIKNPALDENELSKERQVILEEIKIYKDNPRYWMQDNLSSCLFSGSAGMSVAGTEETLKNIGKKEMLEKFKSDYLTENIILCVVGDVDFNFLCDYCEKNFIIDKKVLEEKKLKIEKINKEKIEKRKAIDQANMILAFHSYPAFTKENYALQVLMCILGGGMSSRLWQEIREKRNLAYSVNGNCSYGKNYGYNYVAVGCMPENVEVVRKLILEEFEKVANSLDEKELKQAKEQIIGNSKISREDSQGQMTDLLYNEIWGKAENSYEFEKRISEVKLEDVKKAAKIKNYSFLALVPE